ncbi:sensor histidine kinase [Streptomyces oceani]|uniref:histidine kinase n=1 Tax=Streptomyces oceani TaxID=1075402 RepID=A0A1E7JWV0_9ACTN|nr:sensor histidine kinase [Streptomyces oceani]OEU96125.1 histidine kinase [Streptomyces oceani]
MSAGDRAIPETEPPAVGSAPRRAVGLLLGIPTAVPGLLYFLLVGTVLGPALLWPRTRPAARRTLEAGAHRLAGVERRRRTTFFGDQFLPADHARKVLLYLAARTFAGLLTAFVISLLVFGVVLAVLLVIGYFHSDSPASELMGQTVLGFVLLFLNIQGLISLEALDGRLARQHFGPSERELMRRRIDELALTRAGIVEAVDTERRRIERDLHDGLQQRLVALAMLLGRARRHRTSEKGDALLEQAHRESQEVLGELREVAWRVYPTALDNLGLREALDGVAERCGIPLTLDFQLPENIPHSTQTVAYFVVSESVTNAAKHSAADQVRVSLAKLDDAVFVRIQDNGDGGANPEAEGSGLSGLRRRVAALDGRMRVDSPPGGPTTITAELPCA